MTTTLQRNNSIADQLGMKVEYKGPGTGGQYLWANGSHLVNAVTGSLEEGAARFGSRINLNEKLYARSLPFRLGYQGQPFTPNNTSLKMQEMIEHGCGRLKRMLEQAKTPPNPKAPAQQPVVPEAPKGQRRPIAPPKSGGLSGGMRQALRQKVGK